MTQLIAASWLLQKTLSVAGLMVALAGVATFGWHFVRISARAAQGEAGKISRASWRGRGARFGLSIFASGIILAVASMILSNILPMRY